MAKKKFNEIAIVMLLNWENYLITIFSISSSIEFHCWLIFHLKLCRVCVRMWEWNFFNPHWKNIFVCYFFILTLSSLMRIMNREIPCLFISLNIYTRYCCFHKVLRVEIIQRILRIPFFLIPMKRFFCVWVLPFRLDYMGTRV